jgi:hypothetical protein
MSVCVCVCVCVVYNHDLSGYHADSKTEIPHIRTPTLLISRTGPEGAATLTCVVYFRERKFASEPVEYEVNPGFDGTFLIPLQNEHDDQRMLSVQHLRESADAMHLMVVRDSREGRQVCVCV